MGRAIEERWTLGRDETAHVAAGRAGVRIEVESGLLVVTRSGDPVDHVLRAGESLRLPGRGLVAAWALEPTRASVRRLPDGLRGDGAPARAA